MSNDDSKPRRRRIESAPSPDNPRLPSTVLNVECAADEDVEWVWTQTAQGSFVSGYRIVAKKLPEAGVPHEH